MAGPLPYWAEASAWAKGWNASKGLKWNDPNAVTVKLESDMHDGHINGSTRSIGFYIVEKIVLTQAQRDEIDEKRRKKELEAAQKELKHAMEKVKSLEC